MLFLAELAVPSPTSGFPAAEAAFNPTAHLVGAGLLCLVSIVGVLLPPLLRVGNEDGSALETGVRLGTCFGFGTILATAVVHMLPSAVHSLSSGTPGAPPPSLAYWIILVSLLVMHFLDWVVAAVGPRLARRAGAAAALHALHNHAGDDGDAVDCGTGSTSCLARNGCREGGAEEGYGPSSPLLPGDTPRASDPRRRSARSAAADVMGLALLELGVSMHSTLVGMGLGVARGAAFHTLLVALCVHQFFEGVALGGAAADVAIDQRLGLVLAAIFAASTPLGVVVGVGLREAAGERSQATSTLEGALESFATGILLYVGLVQLLTPHMSRAAWMRRAEPATQAAAFAALWAGAGAMAFLGAWV